MSKSDKRILDIILNYEVVGYIFSNAKVLYLVYKDFFLLQNHSALRFHGGGEVKHYGRIIIQKKVFDFDVRLSLLLLLIKLVLVHLLAISCIISKKLLYGNFFFKKRIFSLHYVCIYALLVQNTREKTTSKSNNSICYVFLFFF